MSSARWARAAFEAAAGLLYPLHCAGCGTPLHAAARSLCRPCRRARTRLTGPRCAVCGQPHGGEFSSAFRCANCGDRELFFEFATAAYRSRGIVRDLIHRFKYDRHLHLGPLLARMLSEGFRDPRLVAEPVDAIVPVPLHPARLRQREFNQSAVLAALASRRIGLPVLDCLQRRRFTTSQTNFHREERFRNLQGAFACKKDAPVEGKRVALVDDVLTTGSTADACARTLRQAGASAVVVITIARG